MKRFLGFFVCVGAFVWLGTSNKPSKPLQKQKSGKNSPQLFSNPASFFDWKALKESLLSNNPQLRVLQKKVDLFQTKEKQMGVWPDLKVGIQVMNFPMPSFDPTTTGMSGIQYSLLQTFPILSKLSVQKEIAQLKTSWSKTWITEKRVSLWLDVKKAVYRIYEAESLFALQQKRIQWIRHFAEILRTKYETGKAKKKDLFLLQSMESKWQERLYVYLQRSKENRFLLQEYLGKSPLWMQKRLKDLPLVSFGSSVSDLWEQAKQKRGIAHSFALGEKIAKKTLYSAELAYYPEVSLSLSVRQRFPSAMDPVGYPFLSLGVQMALPTWGNPKRKGKIQEAMTLHQSVRLQQQQWELSVLRKIQIVNSQLQTHNKQLRIVQNRTEPLLQQAFTAQIQSYQVSQEDILNLLNVLDRLYQEKMKILSLKVNLAILLAQQDALIGIE